MQIVTDVTDAYSNTRKYLTLCAVQKRDYYESKW